MIINDRLKKLGIDPAPAYPSQLAAKILGYASVTQAEAIEKTWGITPVRFDGYKTVLFNHADLADALERGKRVRTRRTATRVDTARLDRIERDLERLGRAVAAMTAAMPATNSIPQNGLGTGNTKTGRAAALCAPTNGF